MNQLHESTLQISKSCFEFKKICVGLIGAVLAVLVKISGNQLNNSYFFIPLLVCCGFWIADSSAYYFQRRNRIIMNEKLDAIADRNAIENYEPESLSVSLLGALFNYSMSLYYALAISGFSGLAYIYFCR